MPFNNKNTYNINFVGLKNNYLYKYKFIINDDFFENSLLSKLDFKIKNLEIEIDLNKSNNLINLNYYLIGSILSNCDRCTNEIEIPILNKYDLIVKMVNDKLNLNDSEIDILYLNFNDTDLKLYDYILEFVLISIPEIKKCNDNGNGKYCNKEILKMFI